MVGGRVGVSEGGGDLKYILWRGGTTISGGEAVTGVAWHGLEGLSRKECESH